MLGACHGIEPIIFVPIDNGKINRSIATMEMIRLAFALIGAATMLAVIVIAIFGRDDDRLNEGLLIGIYVGTFGSISVLFVLRYFGLF